MRTCHAVETGQQVHSSICENSASIGRIAPLTESCNTVACPPVAPPPSAEYVDVKNAFIGYTVLNDRNLYSGGPTLYIIPKDYPVGSLLEFSGLTNTPWMIFELVGRNMLRYVSKGSQNPATFYMSFRAESRSPLTLQAVVTNSNGSFVGTHNSVTPWYNGSVREINGILLTEGDTIQIKRI